MGMFSTMGDIFSTLGVILSTMGDIMMDVGGVSVPWGKSFVISVPQGIEHPHGTHDIPHMYLDIPTVLKLQRMVPLPQYCTPHGTHDIPHVHHDISPWY